MSHMQTGLIGLQSRLAETEDNACKQFFQIDLRLLHAAAVRQLPALREPVDVGINRKRRHMERLRHHHARGLVADAGQIGRARV